MILTYISYGKKQKEKDQIDIKHFLDKRKSGSNA
jgi:hypothetical protein